jgi:hypothetical protein
MEKVIAQMAERIVGGEVVKVSHIRCGKRVMSARVHMAAPGFKPAVFRFRMNENSRQIRMVKMS